MITVMEITQVTFHANKDNKTEKLITDGYDKFTM